MLSMAKFLTHKIYRQVTAFVVTMLLLCPTLSAQQIVRNANLTSDGSISTGTTTKKKAIAPSFSWKLLSPLGLR